MNFYPFPIAWLHTKFSRNICIWGYVPIIRSDEVLCLKCLSYHLWWASKITSQFFVWVCAGEEFFKRSFSFFHSTWAKERSMFTGINPNRGQSLARLHSNPFESNCWIVSNQLHHFRMDELIGEPPYFSNKSKLCKAMRTHYLVGHYFFILYNQSMIFYRHAIKLATS